MKVRPLIGGFRFFQLVSFSAFETRSLPALTHSYPRHFTFYVAHPNRSIQLFRSAASPSRAILEKGDQKSI
jgi:hypothetical protein